MFSLFRCWPDPTSTTSQAPAYFSVYYRLWCPDESRICSGHLIGDDLHSDVIVNSTNRISLKEHISNRADKIINDLLQITSTLLESDPLPHLEYSRLTDNDCKTWTGWTLAQLKEIHDACLGQLPAPLDSCTENALILFWAKVKTNISWPQLSPRGGGYSLFFFIRRLGPSIYPSPLKNIRNFKHPKKIFEILAVQKIPPLCILTLRKDP